MTGTIRRTTRSRWWVAALATSLLVQLLVALPARAQSPSVRRLAGSNRFATAAAVSRDAFPGGAETVFVVTGGDFADALTVSASLAGQAPVLLVSRTNVPAETVTELRRLHPTNIVIVGGTGAISSGVEVRLAALSGYQTVRVAGRDRNETAAMISRSLHPDGAKVAYVTTGYRFPDALSATGAAGSEGAPVLLTTPTVLPDSTKAELQRLQPETIVVVGREGDVSTAVMSQLSFLASKDVMRVAGSDDTTTSAKVSHEAFQSSRRAYVATVASFPDGLTGGAVASGLPAPLLLVQPDRVPDSVACELMRLGVDDIVVLGGSKAISDGVVRELDQGYRAGQVPGCEESPPAIDHTVAVEGAPVYNMVVTADSGRAYLVNNRYNRVEVLDLKTWTLGTPISVGSDPFDLALSRDGKQLFVTNSGSKDISRVDLAAGREVARIPLDHKVLNPGRAFYVETTRSGKLALWPSTFSPLNGGEAATLSLIDPTSPTAPVQSFETKVTGTIGRMQAIADSARIAVSIDNRLGVFDTGTNEFRPKDGADFTAVDGGQPVTELAFSADGKTGAVDSGGGTSFILENGLGTGLDNWLQLRGTVTDHDGSDPTYGMAISNDGQFLYRVNKRGLVEAAQIRNSAGAFDCFLVGATMPLTDSVGGDTTYRNTPPADLAHRVALTPDGKTLLVATDHGVEGLVGVVSTSCPR